MTHSVCSFQAPYCNNLTELAPWWFLWLGLFWMAAFNTYEFQPYPTIRSFLQSMSRIWTFVEICFFSFFVSLISGSRQFFCNCPSCHKILCTLQKWSEETQKLLSRFVNLNPWHTLLLKRQKCFCLGTFGWKFALSASGMSGQFFWSAGRFK